jgi:hypothetical protein
LQQVLHCLREQGDTEEYQEALDLLYRLIKTKDSGKNIIKHKNLLILIFNF